jgi:hypothetical protein
VYYALRMVSMCSRTTFIAIPKHDNFFDFVGAPVWEVSLANPFVFAWSAYFCSWSFLCSSFSSFPLDRWWTLPPRAIWRCPVRCFSPFSPRFARLPMCAMRTWRKGSVAQTSPIWHTDR